MAHGPKKDEGFRGPFRKRTEQLERRIEPPKIKVPKHEVQDIEDRYVSIVLIGGVPEDIFWHADLSFLLTVAESNAVYRRWLKCEEQYQIEKERR